MRPVGRKTGSSGGHREEYDSRKAECFPAFVTHKGLVHRGLLTDLSDGGACVQVEADSWGRPVRVGKQLDMDVKTPYGRSHCVGKVKWIKLRDGHYRMGLEFTLLPESEADPLRCAIASPI